MLRPTKFGWIAHLRSMPERFARRLTLLPFRSFSVPFVMPGSVALSAFGPTVLEWSERFALSGQRSVFPQPWLRTLISGWTYGTLYKTWMSFLKPIIEDLAAHPDAVDKWLLKRNHFADVVASAANHARPMSFWDLYDKTSQEVRTQEVTQRVVVDYHQWMARASTRSAQPAVTEEPSGVRVLGTHPFQWDHASANLGRSPAHFKMVHRACQPVASEGFGWYGCRSSLDILDPLGCGFHDDDWSSPSYLVAKGLALDQSEQWSGSRPLPLVHYYCFQVLCETGEICGEGGRTAATNHRD